MAAVREDGEKLVLGSKSREMMYGDPLHTCKEVSGNGDRIEVEGNDVRRPTLHSCKEVSSNGDRIEVEGHHVRLRIMVSKSRKTR